MHNIFRWMFLGGIIVGLLVILYGSVFNKDPMGILGKIVFGLLVIGSIGGILMVFF